MKKFEIKFALIFAFFLSIMNSFGQYRTGQKFFEFSIDGNYMGSNTTNNNKTTTGITFIQNQQSDITQVALTANLYKAATDKYLQGQGVTLAFSNQVFKGSNVDSADQPFKHSAGNNYSVNLGYNLQYKWLFPLTPKFGGVIHAGGVFSVGYGKGSTSSVTDSNSVITFYNNNSLNGKITLGLTFGIYYWISPRIILQTGINIASANIGVSSNSIETEKGNQDYINYSSNFTIPFSNPQSLAAQYISISYLLK